MNREILFRGKNIDTGEWVYGNLFTVNSTMDGEIFIAIVPTPDYYPGDFIFEDWFSEYIVTPESVGQFTGLTDKNGNKIFEGDVVKSSTLNDELWKNDFKNYVIGFNDGIFCFMLKNKPIRQWKDGSNDWYSIENNESFNIKVIGNIIDNPELIENATENK